MSVRATEQTSEIQFMEFRIYIDKLNFMKLTGDKRNRLLIGVNTIKCNVNAFKVIKIDGISLKMP